MSGHMAELSASHRPNLGCYFSIVLLSFTRVKTFKHRSEDGFTVPFHSWRGSKCSHLPKMSGFTSLNHCMHFSFSMLSFMHTK